MESTNPLRGIDFEARRREDAFKKCSEELQLSSYDENVCNTTNQDLCPVVGLLSQCVNERIKRGCLLITQEITMAVLCSSAGELILVDSHSHAPFGAAICGPTQDASALVQWYQNSFQKYHGNPVGISS
ncbi:uncharacterized protein LOC110244112 [Exaiptasia diaphana]|uniref:Uncharacterized protein n=1 Tax=Exaiptasia diaphana TaxID=2652724 RepID=A0A913YQB2_EXADI|nr:uncharacterized protein LOC110244112 [Exaiptasia diaphana]